MSDNMVPLFEDALRAAETRISASLGKKCRVDIAIDMDEALMKAVENIDHQKFRPELKYTQSELYDRGAKRGFISFMVRSSDDAIATLFGYTDPADDRRFYLDSVATLVEGRGVSSILVLLALIYCHEAGYDSVQLHTEEVDETGRHLRQFYEHLGFNATLGDPADGVCMKHELNPSTLESLYHKTLKAVTENQRITPRPAPYYFDDERR